MKRKYIHRRCVGIHSDVMKETDFVPETMRVKIRNRSNNAESNSHVYRKLLPLSRIDPSPLTRLPSV
jgi:hypothetical protein